MSRNILDLPTSQFRLAPMQTLLRLETAPCSILQGITYSSKTSMTFFCRSSLSRRDLLFPSYTSACSTLFASRRRNLRSGFTAFCSSAGHEQPPPLALLLEVEGYDSNSVYRKLLLRCFSSRIFIGFRVLMDAYRLCNRQAFNKGDYLHCMYTF